MSDRGTFETILGEIGQALLPLQNAVRSPESFFAFAQKLGWQPGALPKPLEDLGAALEALLETLRKLLGRDPQRRRRHPLRPRGRDQRR